MYKIQLFIFSMLGIIRLSAQNFDHLVHKAWENNHQLKSKEFQLQGAEESFKEAKANFGPTVIFGIQYSLAKGGRSISVPVGDLLNPVYSTLNQITNSHSFPQIENAKEQLLPNNFYDAKFRITQAIFYPDLNINKKVKMKMVDMKAVEIKAFKRLLSKEVMMAAVQWNSANYALKIYKATDSLLNEAIRSSKSLIRNGVALPTIVLRLEDQLADSEVQQVSLKAQVGTIKDYIEFLTGETLTDEELVDTQLLSYPLVEESTTNDHEEMKQIQIGIQMQELAKQKENQFYYPRIGAQLDLGSQAFNLGFSPYALLGLNFELPLYDHKKHKYRSLLASAGIQELNEQKEAIQEQIDLQIKNSKRNLQVSIQQAMSYEHRIQTSEKLYQEVFAKYKLGSANYLELLDAQNQWTQSRLQNVIAIHTAWMKWAEYIYSSSKFPIQ